MGNAVGIGRFAVGVAMALLLGGCGERETKRLMALQAFKNATVVMELLEAEKAEMDAWKVQRNSVEMELRELIENAKQSDGKPHAMEIDDQTGEPLVQAKASDLWEAELSQLSFEAERRRIQEADIDRRIAEQSQRLKEAKARLDAFR